MAIQHQEEKFGYEGLQYLWAIIRIKQRQIKQLLLMDG
jgi:hypothetical protein